MVTYPMYNIGGDVGKGIPLWYERNETRNGSKLLACWLGLASIHAQAPIACDVLRFQSLETAFLEVQVNFESRLFHAVQSEGGWHAPVYKSKPSPIAQGHCQLWKQASTVHSGRGLPRRARRPAVSPPTDLPYRPGHTTSPSPYGIKVARESSRKQLQFQSNLSPLKHRRFPILLSLRHLLHQRAEN